MGWRVVELVADGEESAQQQRRAHHLRQETRAHRHVTAVGVRGEDAVRGGLVWVDGVEERLVDGPDEEGGHEGTERLRYDVREHLAPLEAPEERERGGDSGVDVRAGDASRDVDAEDADSPPEAERGVVPLGVIAERDLCDGSVPEEY
ncbi:hypothetical protein ON010_g16903 [Phytophthora cinnamomi]|nr:hypothetical protein ON010_g16903 [Phytophthora cinnamomi]